jgi:hypothetical protein
MPIKPPSSSSSVSPASRTAIASGAIGAKELIYIKSDGTCAKADATTEGKEAIGFTLNAYSNGQTVIYYLPGTTIKGLSGLTPGAPYFMSTTPGAIASMASAPSTVGSGNVRMRIGTAISATELFFMPEVPIVL